MRSHTHKIQLPATPERVFSILHTPSAIREWWGASRAILIARERGMWTAAWGEFEDSPDYVTAATIVVFEQPQRLSMSDFTYYAKSGPLRFEANLSVEFQIEATARGATLRVFQSGFPTMLRPTTSRQGSVGENI